MAIHIVQSGDSLWAISQMYNVSIEMIINQNGLRSEDTLVPGLALFIPNSSIPVRSHLIEPGDTIWKLAQRYQTTINMIISANPGINFSNLYNGQKIQIPSPIKLSFQTLGFIVPYTSNTIIPDLYLTAKNLTYLAIVSYSLTEEGHVYLELDDDTILAESKRLNVTPLLMIRNVKDGEFSSELIGNVLENPSYRFNLILSLLNFIRQKGYGGVSIDFEFIPPSRRQDFGTFLNELKIALGPLILHVNVHAKTEDIPTNRIIGAYDYNVIGNAADIVAIMTIDYGYPTGPPNPVSPIWWMEEVIRYAIGQINPRKLQMALPLYGYDWRLSDNSTRSYSVLGAQRLALSSGAVINFDPNAAAPWFRYWKGTEEHIVWFDDIRSFSEKYKLIDQYSLLGTTYWQLSLPFPQNWAYAEQNFIILQPG